MGVKRHYILAADGELYAGIKAYYYLLQRYKAQFAGGTAIVSPDRFIPTTGGWRSVIRRLYRELRALIEDGSIGALQELKANNPNRTRYYKDVMVYLKAHPTRR